MQVLQKVPAQKNADGAMCNFHSILSDFIDEFSPEIENEPGISGINKEQLMFQALDAIRQSGYKILIQLDACGNSCFIKDTHNIMVAGAIGNRKDSLNTVIYKTLLEFMAWNQKSCKANQRRCS